MSTQPQQPTVDFIQVFCMNFKSHFDLSGEKSHRDYSTRWSDQFEKNWQLKKARQVFEVFQVILGKTDHKGLAVGVLEFYAPTPIEKICSLNVIAEALIKEGLVDSSIDVTELENELAVNYQKWLALAVKRSKEILLPEFPDIEEFEGETAWVKMNGVDRWGPVHTVSGSYYRLLSSLKID